MEYASKISYEVKIVEEIAKRILKHNPRKIVLYINELGGIVGIEGISAEEEKEIIDKLDKIEYIDALELLYSILKDKVNVEVVL